MGERVNTFAEKAKKLREIRDEDSLAIVSCIRKHSPNKITATAVGEEVGLSARRVMDCVYTVIKHKYPEVVSYGRGGYRWEGDGFVDPDETVEEMVKEEVKEEPTENLNKNHEGYPDPTAAAILKRFEQTNNKVRAGEIWSTGNEDLYFLILATFPGLVVGLNVCKIDTWYDPEWDVRILLGKDQYYINIKRLTSRPAKTIIANYGRIDKKRLDLIRASIGGMLNLKTVEEKIVEKPVEVIREVQVPVEKIIEKPVEVEKIIFKTKFDKKKLGKFRIKSKVVEPVSNGELEYMTNKCSVEEARAHAWETAFRLLVAGKDA